MSKSEVGFLKSILQPQINKPLPLHHLSGPFLDQHIQGSLQWAPLSQGLTSPHFSQVMELLTTLIFKRCSICPSSIGLHS